MADTPIPIVLAASGTATAAAATYRQLEAGCRQSFPGHPVHWAYSSRAIRKRMREKTGALPATPQSVLDRLYQSGCRQVVVQSLHLIGGIEFHQLAWQAACCPMAIHLGLPLLSHPEDFEGVLDWIEAVRPAKEENALVLVGHGTAHPAWMAYALLSRKIAERFGGQVLLGQIRGGLTPAAIASRLRAAGYRRVELRPFMLVAGAHFMQDIAGEPSTSWQAQIAQQGLAVTPVAEGLGEHPAIIDLFRRHIRAALDSRPLSLD